MIQAMKSIGLLSILGVSVLVLAACGQTLSAQPVAVPSGVVESTASILEQLPEASEQLLPEEPAPAGAESSFSTDFTKHTIPYSEVLSGGPPKDAIPAIDNPEIVTIEEADSRLQAQEPIIAVVAGDEARAYPVQILMWHEIVNDQISEVPVSVTYCPLCNTGIAFEREFDGRVLDFGTTGRLRFSNLIMYDRQTETWWQQATGEGIAGEYAGRRLELVPAAMIAWEDFKAAYPAGTVLSWDTGYSRDYGRNPYSGYDDIEARPFLYAGPETPGTLPAMARVLSIELNAETVAYPYELLQEIRVANDNVGNEPIVVFWQPGAASALDAFSVAGGADVGAATSYSRTLDGEVFEFVVDGDRIVDTATRSEWSALGRSISGSLEGSQLDPVVSINHFWFSWAAFRPETRVFMIETTAAGKAADERVAEEAAASSKVELVAGFADFEISVYQGSDELGGETVVFSDVLAQGRPVVLNLWAALCPLCRREMPDLQKAHEAYGDEVLVLGIDVGSYVGLGSKENAIELMRELGIGYPNGTTEDASIMRDYQVLGTPANYFLKPNGEVWRKWNGVLAEKQLLENIEGLLEASRPLM
jgi:thiol-disulfide isomerase/thioredoxin